MNTAEFELLDAIAEGDRRAIGLLYEQYVPRLWRFLYRITQDAEMIQELINDVMMTVWQDAARFRRESSVSTWILGIAYHKALDAVRRQRRYEHTIRDAPAADLDSGDTASFMADRDLDTLMVELSPEQRAVAELSFDFGYSYPEIADILDIPLNTVKTRMYYARRTMQAVLEKPMGGGQR